MPRLRSISAADRAWRKKVYTSIPNCRHYVTVAMKSAEVVRFDRADDWKGLTLKGLAQNLALPAIDVTIPLGAIYRWTPVA